MWAYDSGAEMIRKVLVANRGEIAIRVCRAAYELGIRTVAVYAAEDVHSLHRQKADEAYQIGEWGHPVRAYLDIDALLEVAARAGCDALHPGYGFISESPELARACDRAGLVFVGPPASVLELTGNKLRAVAAARAADVPVLRSSGPIGSPDEAEREAAIVGFPLFVKAAAGGGGRGLRKVVEPGELDAAVAAASREAESAFGDATVYLEEACIDARHIEVQVLADATGAVVHLYERDCSIQRRHQKVIEMAPAPGLDPALRVALCESAVRFAGSIGYVNAGTVEYLVGPSGRFVFIEMNPRIQVEHTVTEETTDVDLVRSQLRIAGGETLDDLGLTQDQIVQRGAAIQCRVTAEDPAQEFRPDTGRISTFRIPGGAGVRLDGGFAHQGAEITPWFDSLIIKITCRGPDFATALARTRRALAEIRIRGISTNVEFLQDVLADPDVAEGRATTSFLDERPTLFRSRRSQDRATRLLSYLADVTVNQPYGAAPIGPEPATKLPPLPSSNSLSSSTLVAASASGPAPMPGSRQRLLALGPAEFARALRLQVPVAVTDTTLRDAHQSLLATRMRTFDMLAVAGHIAQLLPGLWSLECWGGATYDVALRFLNEDPWERLARLRDAVPNLCLQMLLRGRNTVGYSPYPEAVCRAFVDEAARTGVDVFRIFDALNDVDQMRPAIDAVLEVGALAEGALCYTGDLSDPAERLYTLDHYLRVAEGLAEAGVHVLCVKDMAGLLRAPAARTLVASLRERFDQPVHLHTHDTSGGQMATYLAAIDEGVDAVDGAFGPLAGTTSQPPLAAIVAATDHTPRASGLSLDALADLEPYWRAVRTLYAPFESGHETPTASVYRHEMPGGQISNLRQQAIALGLGDRFELVEELYGACDKLLGRIIKVTPTSKVVGDLALALAASGVTMSGVAASGMGEGLSGTAGASAIASLEAHPESFDLPDSVVAFLHGELGTPPGGWPEPFRTRALRGRPARPEPPALDEPDRRALAEPGVARRRTLDRLLFPAPARDHEAAVARHGDLSVLDTRLFLYGLAPSGERAVDLEPGVRLFVGLEAIGEPDARGIRNVVCTLNGQLRPVDVRDHAIASEQVDAERADPADPHQVAAPFSGVVHVVVSVGQAVAAGEAVATIEAMKMEATITAPHAGTIARIAIGAMATVQAGDLVVIVE